MTVQSYVKVHSITDAFSELQKDGLRRIIVGGTDLLIKGHNQRIEPFNAIDIGDVPELAGITETQTGVRIGAVTKLADIASSQSLKGALQVLSQGAVLVGSPQIRNMASLGGNLCNAAPSADTAAPLIALNASVEILSPNNNRTIPLETFFTGPGATVLAKNEILAAVHIPYSAPGSVGLYIKHTPRRAMDLAIVGIAVVLWHKGGKLQARIALSAVAPTPLRARLAEVYLEDKNTLNSESIATAAQITSTEITPISDIRSTTSYRIQMVRTLTARALTALSAELGGWEGE
ncbi:MAG: FAD binding domain-containing protein [Leptolinea sp.]